MRTGAGASSARIAAWFAIATVAVVAWFVWPRPEPAQWPTVSDRQVARAVRAEAGRSARPTAVTCRPVAIAWKCLVRYPGDRSATCSVGLRERPMVNREPRFVVIC